jgi:hypothetical protein
MNFTFINSVYSGNISRPALYISRISRLYIRSSTPSLSIKTRSKNWSTEANWPTRGADLHGSACSLCLSDLRCNRDGKLFVALGIHLRHVGPRVVQQYLSGVPHEKWTAFSGGCGYAPARTRLRQRTPEMSVVGRGCRTPRCTRRCSPARARAWRSPRDEPAPSF